MGKWHWCLFFVVVLFAVAPVAAPAELSTDPLDGLVLRDMYRSFNQPKQLIGWRLNGGDPCYDEWFGIECYNNNVISLSLSGMKLRGTISPLLKNIRHLSGLDLSNNRITGEIPNELPPMSYDINLGNNFLQNNLPNLRKLNNLRSMNVSHNRLSGPINNVFIGLHNLRKLDLGYNNFTGDLPETFKSLKNLTTLYLQYNRLTGVVDDLAELRLLEYLNLEHNCFSGTLPYPLTRVPHLWIAGNNFGKPSTASQCSEAEEDKKRKLGPEGIALIVGGVVVAAVCIAVYMGVDIKVSNVNTMDSELSLPVTSSAQDSATSSQEQTTVKPTGEMVTLVPRKKGRRKRPHDKRRFPARIKVYTVAELQSATNQFLGGSVYKAEFPDGQILVIKNMKMSGLSFHEEEEEKFLDLVWTLSRLKHPNIVPLLGYCVEHGQHILVYEYVRNLSLDEALHIDAYKPLSWGLRLQIALGVAQALDYLHSTLSPPVGHGNLKSANILLAEDLAPHICDCGLAILRPLTSKRLKLKASEDAIGDTGYFTPEHGLPGFDNIKSDIYAFGVLLLELLTGRKPFDSSKPGEEQSLVKLASLRRHDSESLGEMIDPGIKMTASSKDLIFDIVFLCIQPVEEFRLLMSEVVGSLSQLMRREEVGQRQRQLKPSLTPVKFDFCLN